MKNTIENRIGAGRAPQIESLPAGKPPALPQRFGGTLDELVAKHRPADPVYVIWPDRITAQVARFRAAFAGEPMYAVKANPDKAVLQAVWKGGVSTFDAASIEEIRLVRKVAPSARICYMHPVKSREAIREAYRVHGVKTFVADREEEVRKILEETGNPADLTLFVRMAPPRNDSAAIDFSTKFGASLEETAALLAFCRPVCASLGLCFHVGHMTADPKAFNRAVAAAATAINQSGVKIDALDVGGGFPVGFGSHVPPPIEHFMKVIDTAVAEHGLDHIPLLAEPGRCLVADAASLIVRVEQRRGDTLYINDGTYRGLFDAGPMMGLRFPVRAVRPDTVENPVKDGLTSYRFAGPTCDSFDMMEGPFDLPANMKEGDWIEIGMTGAYSVAMRSNFNGFGKAHTVCMKPSSSKRKLRIVR